MAETEPERTAPRRRLQPRSQLVKPMRSCSSLQTAKDPFTPLGWRGYCHTPITTDRDPKRSEQRANQGAGPRMRLGAPASPGVLGKLPRDLHLRGRGRLVVDADFDRLLDQLLPHLDRRAEHRRGPIPLAPRIE